jgi:uncharacterized protein
MKILLTAITPGFPGSLHCAGMCGPIALALPIVNKSKISRITGILFYNKGRIFTYGFLGILFGLLGRTFVIAGYQQVLSVTLGILILAFVVLPLTPLQRFTFDNILLKPVSKLKIALGKLFDKKTYGALFSIGVLNGVLPCGLVYAAVAGAIAVAQPAKAGLFMMSFGLGTLPAMMALLLTGQKVNIELRNKFKKLAPVFVVAMALLLIVRGMNLGTPYVSPELDKSNCTKYHCCTTK